MAQLSADQIIQALNRLVEADVNMHVTGSEMYSDAERGVLVAAAQKLKQFKDALEFYRDPISWKKSHDPDHVIGIPDFYGELDFGQTADAALTVGQSQQEKS